LLARSVFKIIFDITEQWHATAKSMGATPIQTLRFIVLPESMPEIIRTSAHNCGLIVTFSAIAGALGAGGLGQLAIEKSIHDPSPILVLLSILIVVVMQQLIEYTGTLVVQQTQPR
jgi:D-methionine transport system permease protein